MDMIQKISALGIVPVIKLTNPDNAVPLCRALARGGLPVAEITFRTAAAEESIRRVAHDLPEILVGAGTVLTTEQADKAMAAGAKFIPGRALSVTPLGGGFGVAVGNDFFMCRAVILAVGLTRESLYPGEAEFLGRGVSYCATCDGMLYRGKTVAVIGAGAEARHDADFLEGIGCTALRFEENLRFEIRGGERVQTLVAGATEYSVDCVFIIKESIAVTRLVPGLDSSKRGITVTRAMATNVAGVFAAGDCTGKPYQLAKAVGEGNVAALSACEYIDAKEK